nr:PREDICTED: CD209 antigen-like protein C [Lepisosteus oculatus]
MVLPVLLFPPESVSGMKAESSPPPYRLAAVCLGLLCAALLIAIIALSVYHGTSSHSARKEITTLTAAVGQLRNERTQFFTVLSEKFPILQQYCQVAENGSQEFICKACPSNWINMNSTCYYFSSDAMNWNESFFYCRFLGANLVIINSDEKQKFVFEHSKETYWIGLNDAAKEDTFMWVDGTKLTKGYWNKRQPDNHEDEDCVTINPVASFQMAWNDLKCSIKERFICEAKALDLSADSLS